MVQPCILFKEEPSQFFMGQIAQSLTCSIMEKPLQGWMNVRESYSHVVSISNRISRTSTRPEMAYSELFCAPINPCTWYRGLFLCPLDTGEVTIVRKWTSFVMKLNDEMSSIVQMEREGVSLREKYERYLKEWGMHEDPTSSIVETAMSSIMILFVINFFNIVGNTQLWLTLCQSIKNQLHRQLWLRWLVLWENIKERICEDYLKMPGGLEPHRYHTRYYVGLNRLRVMEFGIIIRVLPDLSHEGIRCFDICGIAVYTGHPIPVPPAPYA